MSSLSFTTFGSLKLKLYEIIDAFQDENDRNKYDGIWINVTLLDDKKEKVCSFSAEGKCINGNDNNGNDKFLIDEEFTFNDVSSAHYIIFTIFTTYDYNIIEAKDENSLNKKFSRITRFRTSNDNLNKYLNTNNTDNYNVEKEKEKEIHYIGVIEIPINRLEEHVPIHQWYQFKSIKTNEGLRAAIRTELLYEKNNIFNNNDLQIDTKLGNTIPCEAIHTVESNEKSSPTLDFSSNDINLSHYYDLNNNTEDKGIMAFRIGEEDDDDEYDEQLPVGLIDYCLIFGPVEYNETSLKSMINNSELTNQSINQASSWTRTNLLSPTSGSDSSPTFESNVKLWDRYPLTDRPDKGLPSRIEWFACPEGSLVTIAEARPAPTVSTFILSSGDDAGDLYGICLRFTLDSDVFSEKIVQTSESEVENNNYMIKNNQWWTEEISHTNDNKSNTSIVSNKVWIGIQLCLLTQNHYVNELSQALNILYESTIKNNIELWEQSPQKFSFQLNLGCELLLSKLMNYCPAPLPGIFSATVTFKGNFEKVTFKPSAHNELPTCDYPLESILLTLGPRATVDVITFALAESKILFHSASLNKLPGICEALRTLLYPLRWPHVYIPIVPAPLLDLVEAPVPFILGTNSNWLKFIPESCLQDVIIINLDDASIDTMISNPIKFPDTIDRWLIYGMKNILYNEESNLPFSKSKQLQFLVYDVMFHLFRGVPSCLFYLGPDIPVFNRTIFLANHASNFCKQYLDAVTDTTSFHQFSESINSPFLSYFRQCIQVQELSDDKYQKNSKKIVDTDSLHKSTQGNSYLLPEWIFPNDNFNILDDDELFLNQLRKYDVKVGPVVMHDFIFEYDRTERSKSSIYIDDDLVSNRLVIFDHKALDHVDNFFNWTLNNLCEKLGINVDDFEDQNQNHQTSPVSQSKKKLLSAVMKSNKDIFISKKDKIISDTFENFTNSNGNALVQYLQRVLSGDEISDNDEKSLLNDCKSLLLSSYYRENLIAILKQGKAGERNDDIRKISTEVIVPTNAFEALSKLFAVVIEACVLTDDFLSAYDLLECGGQYCHEIDIGIDHRVFRDRRNSIVTMLEHRSISTFSSEKSTEFLSGRFRNHPIYQSIKLWTANLDKRLSNIKVLRQESENDNENYEIRKITPAEIIREVHSLLYVMNLVGINRERANLFIQTITAEYAIEDSFFFNLSRFVNRLWPKVK